MSKFKFRLATLLQLREADRDERRGELAEARRADEILNKQQKELEASLAELAIKYRKDAAPGPINVERLVEAQQYEFLLHARKKQLIQQRETVAAEIERHREQVVEANREVRTLEKLKERQIQRHRKEEDRRESKALDDLARLKKLREKVSY